MAVVDLDSEIASHPDWQRNAARYANGEYRTEIFRDMIMADVSRCVAPPVMLDIGCGRGFDDDAKIQAALIRSAGQYIGVEPDEGMAVNNIPQLHSCLLEDAPIADQSIDIAFSVMVLEHVENPAAFWAKVFRVLRPQGVFWGFTVDARHWFVRASSWLQRTGTKDRYLAWLHGQRGSERYPNYPVCYKTNTPDEIKMYTQAFSEVSMHSFRKLGQLDYYFPRGTRWPARMLDYFGERFDRPGAILAVRVVK